MDHAGPDVRCFKKAVKLNHSLTHSFLTPESAEVFFKHILKYICIFYHLWTRGWTGTWNPTLWKARTHSLHSHYCGRWWPGPRFSIKMTSYQYRKSHCGDKTVVRASYLHSGISYTGKMTSLYWIRTLATQGARSSVVMVLTYLSQNIPASAPKGLIFDHMICQGINTCHCG